MKNEENKEYTSNLEWGRVVVNSIPCLYQVVLHNDDFTPMEFVIGVLEKFFYMDRSQAAEKMLKAHMDGHTTCGLFSKDVAASKVEEVVQYAMLNDHPLICSMEVA